MKRRVTERVLVLILSIAVLLSSTGVYSVFAENYSDAVSDTSTTVSSSSSSAAANESEPQESTTSADEKTTEIKAEPNVISEGGAVETEKLKGTGTESDPYRITNADDLFRMQDIINDSASSDKIFTLTDDIDLSAVSYAQLKENSVLPGTIVSVDKSKSDASPNAVQFTLNGRNHKIYGLNVVNTGSAGIGIFGYISANSTIKNIKFENITVKVSYSNAVANSAIVLYNNGQFRNCEISNVLLNISSSVTGSTSSKTVGKSLRLVESTGIVAVNNGTISNLVIGKTNIDIQSDKKNIGAVSGINTGKISNIKVSGTTVNAPKGDKIGVAAGRNSGKIESVTADSIKADVASKAVFGGIAGENSGTVVSCVTSGKANGSSYTGGIVGKAVSTDAKTKTSNVKNCSTFVRVAANSEYGAVIATGESRYSDNTWSSENSGRTRAYADGAKDGDIIRNTKLVVVKAGSPATLSKASLGGKSGEISFAPDTSKEFKYEGSGITYSETEENIVINAESADKTGKITYTAKVAVPAGYENSAVVSQSFTVVVLTVPEGTNGNGLSEETALEISNSAELKMIKAAPFAHFTLVKDVKMPENWDSSFSFTGSLNGNGNRITASGEFCSAVYGKISNLNVVLNGTISSAMFGKAYDAEFLKVKLTKGTAADENTFVGLSAAKSGVGAFLNKVSGKTVLDECYTNIPVKVKDESIKNVAGFIGVLDSEEAVIKSCGASTSITGNFEGKTSSCAAFIGKASENKNGKVENCYATLYSDLTAKVIIGGGSEKIKVENSYFSSSNDKAAAAPEAFKNVKAKKWAFKEGEQGFISGKGSTVSIILPEGIINSDETDASDFSVMFDADELKVDLKNMTVENGTAVIPVESASQNVTVVKSALVLVHKNTGLRAEISISNGLEKDKDGNYIISSGSDFVFLNDNFKNFGDKSFVLGDDIDMSEVKLSAIGGASETFTGKLNGKGHTISGLKVNSEAKAALFGSLDGATVKNITFKDASVKSGGSYAGVLAAQVSGKSVISGISFENCKVSAEENFAGILAGEIKSSSISDIKIKNSEVSGLNNAGVLAGFAGASEIKNINAETIRASGENNVGLIGSASDVKLNSVSVKNAEITSKKTAGGIIAAADKAELSAITISDSEITVSADEFVSAPAAGGIFGTFSGRISDAKVVSSKIKANGSSSVAGGVAAIVENAEFTSVSVDKKTKVSAPVAGGIVGEAAGAAEIKNSKSCADVAGNETSSKVIEGVGGIIGRVTAENFGKIKIENTNSAGSVKAADYAGGIIGSVLSLKVDGASVKNCVSASEIDVIDSQGLKTSGHIIGYVGNLKAADIEKAVENVVFSSYASDVSAYGGEDAPSTYCDLDSAVKSSLSGVLRNSSEVTVNVANDKAEKAGFAFNSRAGWLSESEKRISVVSSSENAVVIKALKSGKTGIVAEYQLESDNDITLKVHFDAEAEIHSSLKGSGTKTSPYIISDAFDLETVSEYADDNAYFVLENDIVFSAEDFEFGGDFYNEGNGFTPIGTKKAAFNGTFDGAGHKISGIKINGTDFASLFGFVSDGEIKNVVIENAEVSAQELAAGIAASAKNSKISGVKVIDSSITAVTEKGSAAAVAAFAENTVISDAEVVSTEIAACKADSDYMIASAGAVCARAVNVTISNAAVSEDCKVVSDGYAGGFIGYCEKAVINNSEAFAQTEGNAAAAVAGTVKDVLQIENVVAGGKVSGETFAAGIAAKAYTAIKADKVVVSAEISGENKTAVVAAYADESVFTDSAKSEVKLSDIIYSSYQNSAMPFASAKINAYQNADYLDAVRDVNQLTAKNGEFVAVGKDKLKVADAVEFGYDMSSFNCTEVKSSPENLVKYDEKDGTVTAAGTQTEGAMLVLRYDNGLETAVPLVCIEGMTGSGTEKSPYAVVSEDTLKLLGVYPDAVFVMKNDIDLSDEWKPIENFSGIFDGAGYNISGLKVKANEAGLFASISGNAVVKNISFSEAEIEGKATAGVVAANVADSAKISGINVISSSIKADGYAGAVVGSVQALDAEINSCTVTGSTVTAQNAAGVAGAVSGKVSMKNNSVDAAEISGTETAGGIVAVSDADKLVISESESTADVSAKNAGAVVGSAENSIDVVACEAGGKVSGKNTEGGIIGLASGSVSVKDSNTSSELSGEAKHTAMVVAKFAELPEDNESFRENFSGNTVTGEYDEFEPAVMQYQNFVPADKEETKPALKGSGTKADPYVIASTSDLAQIPDSSSAYFVLESDIKITEKDYGISVDENGETVQGVFSEGYKPVKNFAGVFDGKGHTIKGLYIDSDSDFVGLFANVTANGTVKNLHVELLEKSEGLGYYGIKGGDYVGGIAGYCDSVNGIENCSVTGSSISGRRAVGGIAGGLAASEISGSIAMCEINAQNNAGGIAGIASGKSSIRNSIAACEVNAAGGTVVGVNNGELVLSDVMANGISHGTGAVAVAENNGVIKASKVLITGSNEDGKTAILNADEASAVYSDRTALGITEDNITALSTSQLTSSVPEGLDGWKQSAGKYPVPAMADSYMNRIAAAAAAPLVKEVREESEGNVKVKYSLVNSTGEKNMDSKLVGVLIKSNVEGTTVTSDFFTTCKAEKKDIEKILVTSGGFYVDSSLPEGYEFRITAKDSSGKTISVSDAGNLGAYIESGVEDEVNLVITIIRTDIPWGTYSLWESLKR